jgi:hypothetical protein
MMKSVTDSFTHVRWFEIRNTVAAIVSDSVRQLVSRKVLSKRPGAWSHREYILLDLQDNFQKQQVQTGQPHRR